MAQNDSIDKIVKSYFVCVTNEPFTYKGIQYTPKPLRVSPMLLRGFSCPSHCAACCTRFSLDYLPSEQRPDYITEQRSIDFSTESVSSVTIYSDMQTDHDDHYCRNVNKNDGRCSIHGVHPFSCDFELIRFMEQQKDDRQPGFVPEATTRNILTQKLYGRGWNMLRIDDERGALCTMTTPTDETIEEVVRKLKRLEEWLNHFGIKKHKVTRIVEWAEAKSQRPLTLA